MGAQAACRSSAKGRPVGTDWLIRIAPLAAWGMRALTSKIDTASRPSEQAPRSAVLTSAQGPRRAQAGLGPACSDSAQMANQPRRLHAATSASETTVQ